MITAIYNALSWLVDAVVGVFEFIQWFITSIVECIIMGVRALGACVVYIEQFPVVLIAPFTAIITIAIIFKIKG